MDRPLSVVATIRIRTRLWRTTVALLATAATTATASATLSATLSTRLSAQPVDGASSRAAPPPEGAIVLEGVYTGDIMGVAAGGIRRDQTFLGNLDLKAHLHGGPLVGWPGSLLFAYVLSTSGGRPSELVGDIQGVNNIAAPVAWRLYEFWFQQSLLQDRLSLLAGLYNLNSEFDAIESAGLFLNSSFGVGAEFAQSGQNGPSIFPTTSLALRAKFTPRPGFYAALAVLDGVPGDPTDPASGRISLGRGDGALIVTELALLSDAEEQPDPTEGRAVGGNLGRRIGRGETEVSYRGKLALGAWAYTAQFEDLVARDALGDPIRRTGNAGVYLLGERKLFRAPEQERGLAAFARVGISRADLNRLGSYAGAGLSFAGPFAQRPDDEAGIAIAIANNGTPYRRAVADLGGTTRPRETIVELSYRVQIRSSIAIQPDVQWVVGPGTDPALRNALVLGLRVEAAFIRD